MCSRVVLFRVKGICCYFLHFPRLVPVTIKHSGLACAQAHAHECPVKSGGGSVREYQAVFAVLVHIVQDLPLTLIR